MKRDDVRVTAADLLSVPDGEITEKGLKLNIDVGIQYLNQWLLGLGCVPIYNLMEDAATAEISRTQVWQWLHHGAHLNDGRKITTDLIRETIASQLQHIRSLVGERRFAAGKIPKRRPTIRTDDDEQSAARFLDTRGVFVHTITALARSWNPAYPLPSRERSRPLVFSGRLHCNSREFRATLWQPLLKPER